MSVVSGPAGRAGLGSSGNVIPPTGKATTDSAASWGKALERQKLRDRSRKGWAMAERVLDDPRLKTPRLCGVPPISGRDGVEVRTFTDAGVTRAAILGTTSCGSANSVCPVCTGRVREKRREELEAMIRAGVERGYRFALVTATLRHTRETGPAQQRHALEAGWRAITQGKQSQQRRDSGTVVGTVRSIEFQLCGPAGPHGHIHAIVAIAPGVHDVEVEADFAAMGQRWRDHAEHNMDGLRPDDAHGWAWEFARVPTDTVGYISKVVDGDGWNVSHEVARGDVKLGRGGSLSPLQLLAKAVAEMEATGDIGLMLRMAEFAKAVRGMRAIVVSRSFKKAMDATVDDRTDDELAADPEALGEGWVTAGFLATGAWLHLARTVGVGAVLEAASRHGTRGLASLLDGTPWAPDCKARFAA